MKEHILLVVSSLAIDFLYYQRKEDEELPVGTIEDEIDEGRITIDEMVEAFRKALIEELGE